MTNIETREAVLDVAQELLQTRGYNAFSFRDLANRVQIKTSSVHYYFPTKSELCRALIAKHRERVSAAFVEIDAEGGDSASKLKRYVGIFQTTLETGNRMCLCGMLASDSSTLTLDVVRDLRQSFDDHEVWLEQVLITGRELGSIRFEGSARDEARSLLSSLEGSILVARTFEDPKRFESDARRLLSKLGAEPDA